MEQEPQITGTTTYNDVNATYSAFEYNIAGTISGSPAISFYGDYIGASAQSKGTISAKLSNKYPISLNAAGSARLLGTLELYGEGLGAGSACKFTINWREVR